MRPPYPELFTFVSLLLLLVAASDPQAKDTDAISSDLPSALRIREHLRSTIKPNDIVIVTGGNSSARRRSGFALYSAESLQKFVKTKGYQLVFLDELDFNRNLTFGRYRYTGHWTRVFALPSLRKRFPSVKYFVWADDDVLVPYPETDMLHHYLNMMEDDPECEMTFGIEVNRFVFNSGLIFFKNNDFAFNVYKRALALGREQHGRLAQNFGHEQEAVAIIRKRFNYTSSIKVLPRRDGPYNFNTFARNNYTWDIEEFSAVDGDAFVHFLGADAQQRETKMKELIQKVAAWRASNL